MASWLLGRQSDCGRLARAKTLGDFTDILGVAWSSGSWSIAPQGTIVGNDSSYARLLAMAGKGPTKDSTSAPPSSSQNPNNSSQASSENPNPGGDPGGHRPKARKKRALADEIVGKAVGLPDGLKKERDKALAKVKRTSELEKDLEEDKGKIKFLDRSLKSSEEVRKLSQERVDKKIEEFEGSVSKLKGEVEELILAKDSLEGKSEELSVSVRYLANDVLETSKEHFDNALEQVQLCNPGLVIDKSVVHISHIVMRDQIVKPMGKQDGTSLMIYKRQRP